MKERKSSSSDPLSKRDKYPLPTRRPFQCETPGCPIPHVGSTEDTQNKSYFDREWRLIRLSMKASKDFTVSILELKKLLSAAFDRERYVKVLETLGMAWFGVTILPIGYMELAYERECDLAEEICELQLDMWSLYEFGVGK
jgi:hypothetical protein